VNDYLPGSIECYRCGMRHPSHASQDSDGLLYIARKVIAFGPLVTNRADSLVARPRPRQTYILECGHLVI
jgi:hypothetical protein